MGINLLSGSDIRKSRDRNPRPSPLSIGVLWSGGRIKDGGNQNMLLNTNFVGF
jgi:hypothetical protein